MKMVYLISENSYYMKLSIIIVNYNVKFFLEQCLFAVEKAMKGIEGEIFVVDNNSVDGSVAMIQHRFPNVKLIENYQNVGFSRANNQALEKATGEYVLLLNPDTVIEENTLSLCSEFMDQHPEAGALGPKMIDGKANFLPESKRGLPTPQVAFYKIFGLTHLFPSSRKFGQYYLGHTSPEEIQPVDVLTGAFMFIRSLVLNKIGFLDENFFMYGEDIDLSYRITKSGYINYYFPKTTIIHYKGESTRKGSLNYVILFYKAMQIFAEKHFFDKNTAFLLRFITSGYLFESSLIHFKRFYGKGSSCYNGHYSWIHWLFYYCKIVGKILFSSYRILQGRFDLVGYTYIYDNMDCCTYLFGRVSDSIPIVQIHTGYHHRFLLHFDYLCHIARLLPIFKSTYFF